MAITVIMQDSRPDGAGGTYKKGSTYSLPDPLATYFLDIGLAKRTSTRSEQTGAAISGNAAGQFPSAPALSSQVPVTASITSSGGVGILNGEGVALPLNFLANLALSAFPPVERVIVLGASHEVQALGSPAKISDAVARVQAATGKTIALECYAVDGANTKSVRDNQWPAAVSANSATPRNGKTLVIIACGGNDVSPIAPLDSNADFATIDAAGQHIEWMIDQIEARGWDWHLQDLSWRDYNPPSCRINRSLGSWPWVERINRGITARRYAGYQVRRHPDGSAWGNAYAWMRNNRQYLGADGVHPTDPAGSTAYRNFIVDYVIVPAVQGTRPPVLVPRDETYPVNVGVGVTFSGATLSPVVTPSHQGIAYALVVPRGGAATQAQIVAGSGGLAACNANVTGTNIDTALSLPAVTPTGGYGDDVDILSVLVADTNQSSPITRKTAGDGRVLMIFGSQAATTSVQGLFNLLKWSIAGGYRWSGLKDRAGNDSPIYIETPTPFDTAAENGDPTLSAGILFPVASGTGSWITTGTASIRIFGLVPGATYSLSCAGVRSDTSDAGNRITYINANGVTGNYNASKTAAVAAGALPSVTLTVQADVVGKITMTVARGSDPSWFGYISALSIQRIA